MLGMSQRDHRVIFQKGHKNPQGTRGNARTPQGAQGIITLYSQTEVEVDGNRKLVTFIDCICADGTFLPPFIIMKGQQPSYGWIADSKLEKEWIAALPNGWTDSELGMAWLEKIFEPETAPKYAARNTYPLRSQRLNTIHRANGKQRELVFDNHETHLTYDFIEYAWDHKVLVTSLPPKTSGVSQPLDVAVFGPLQKEYGREVDREVRARATITKQDFAR